MNIKDVDRHSLDEYLATDFGDFGFGCLTAAVLSLMIWALIGGVIWFAWWIGSPGIRL